MITAFCFIIKFSLQNSRVAKLKECSWVSFYHPGPSWFNNWSLTKWNVGCDGHLWCVVRPSCGHVTRIWLWKGKHCTWLNARRARLFAGRSWRKQANGLCGEMRALSGKAVWKSLLRDKKKLSGFICDNCGILEVVAEQGWGTGAQESVASMNVAVLVILIPKQTHALFLSGSKNRPEPLCACVDASQFAQPRFCSYFHPSNE